MIEAVRLAIDAGVFNGEPITVAYLLWAHVHGLITLHLAGRLPLPILEQLIEASRLTPGTKGPVGLAVPINPSAVRPGKKKNKTSR